MIVPLIIRDIKYGENKWMRDCVEVNLPNGDQVIIVDNTKSQHDKGWPQGYIIELYKASDIEVLHSHNTLSIYDRTIDVTQMVLSFIR
jgi:hypothetical protein